MKRNSWLILLLVVVIIVAGALLLRKNSSTNGTDLTAAVYSLAKWTDPDYYKKCLQFIDNCQNALQQSRDAHANASNLCSAADQCRKFSVLGIGCGAKAQACFDANAAAARASALAHQICTDADYILHALPGSHDCHPTRHPIS